MADNYNARKSSVGGGRLSSASSPNPSTTYSVTFQEHYTEVTPLLADHQQQPEDNVFLDHYRRNSAAAMTEDKNATTTTTTEEGDQSPTPQKDANLTRTFSTYGFVGSQEGKRITSFSYDSPLPKYQAVTNNTSIVICGHGSEIGADGTNSCEECAAQVENGLQTAKSQNGHGHPGDDHCHTMIYPAVDKAARVRLITASVLCLVFMTGEIIGGYLAGSLAIMTDAAHLLTDFASFMISLFSLWMATKPATQKMSFGWHRAEVMGALTSVLLIWVVTGILVYMAVERIISQEYDINAEVMLITSGVGVGVNILMGVVLYCQGGSHGHSHFGGSSHGHSHGDGHGKRKEDNINIRAAFIHVIGDFLQSIGVFIAALIIFFKPEWGITDPICTFLFSIIVLVTTITILKDVLMVLMEGSPKGIKFSEVQQTFLSIDGVVIVHNLRIWSLSMDKVALAAHVVIKPSGNTKQILKEASQLIRSKFNFMEITLQIEEYIDAMQDCTQCKVPED